MKDDIVILKKRDDNAHGIHIIRVSMGGNKDFGGYYVTYRGNINEVVSLVEECLQELKGVQISGKEPELSDDLGKHYA